MKPIVFKTSRRAFLRQGATALSGALAAPLIIPSSAFGRGRMKAPSERITMGFIGLGGQGTGHLLGGGWTYVPGGYIVRDDVQVLAVCDVRRERRWYGWATGCFVLALLSKSVTATLPAAL